MTPAPQPMPDLPPPPAAVTNALNELRMVCWVWTPHPGRSDHQSELQACNAVLGRDDPAMAHYADLGLDVLVGLGVVVVWRVLVSPAQDAAAAFVRRWRERRNAPMEPY